MGHKVHPRGFRTSVLYGWPSKWFGGRQYTTFLREDVQLRAYIREAFLQAGIADVEVERGANTVTITIHAARPGVMIGRGGAGLEELRKTLLTRFFPGLLAQARAGRRGSAGAAKAAGALKLNIAEVSQPSLSAPVVLSGMTQDLERRLPFRRVLKQTIERVERAGAKGVKVSVSGRLGGAEIARRETLGSGKIPLHTLRADIDYAQGIARTTYGAIGVKIWIYRGDVFSEKSELSKSGKSSESSLIR